MAGWLSDVDQQGSGHLTLLDPSGRRRLEVDIGGGRHEGKEYRATATGKHRLRVTGSGQPPLSYGFIIGSDCRGGPTTKCVLKLNKTQSRLWFSESEQDWRRVDLEARRTYVAEVQGYGAVWFVDRAGKVLGGGGYESATFRPSKGGLYYVLTRTLESDNGAFYELRLTRR